MELYLGEMPKREILSRPGNIPPGTVITHGHRHLVFSIPKILRRVECQRQTVIA